VTRSLAPDGIERIRKALVEAYKAAKNGVKINIEYIGAPKYRIVIEAEDYKVAEKTLKDAVNRVLRTIKKLGGYGNFVREAA